jgi:DNA primase
MFRKRLLFPIFNVRGKVIGFGGRALVGNDLPKYLNSPDTRLYNKGRELYGLSHTLDYIKESGYIIIVEGYMDFLTSFQGGVRNIAATLGTALTIEHIRVIKRYTSNVVIVYDGDAAGELASLRGLDMLVEEGLNVRIVTLPEGFDPDDYVRSRGAQEFREKTSSGAKDLFDYKLGLLLTKYDKSKLEDKAIISREMLQTISKIDNAIIKSGYIKRLAEKLNVVESAILEELRKVKVNTQSGRDTVIPSAQAGVLAEKMALGLLLEIPDVLPEVEDILSPEYFNTPQMQRIADAILKLKEKNLSITPASLMNYLKDDKLNQIVSEITVTVDGIEDKKKNLLNCISWLRKNNLKVKLKNLEARISLAQGAKDNNLLQGLMSQYNHLIRSRN